MNYKFQYYLSHKQVSTGSLDDIYMCKKSETASSTFKRNEKERFSARFKLGSRLKVEALPLKLK